MQNHYTSKNGKWRLEISGSEDDAKITYFGDVPRHVKSDVARFNGSGYKYTFDQLENYAKLFIKRRNGTNEKRETLHRDSRG